jgi:cytochrome c oxidase subunit I+III
MNAGERVGLARLLVALGIVASLAAVVAGLAGPWLSGMDPTLHSYPAIVWTLAIWTAAHAGVAAIMQGYVLARSLAGRMTPRHDADIRNVSVYTHFFALTAAVTALTLGLFPLLA